MTQWTNLIPTNIQKLAAWGVFWLSLDYVQSESEAFCDKKVFYSNWVYIVLSHM
jgi:hypothetical protein